jgi:cytochrome c oxidase cbb3-type subunit 3
VKVHGVYDGIEEEDNRLPLWWLVTLFGAIVFAFGYWLAFHSTHLAETPLAEFQRRQLEAKQQEQLKNPISDESLWALSKDPHALQQGQQVFTTICVACHKADASGSVGPNLTDRYWLHGNRPTNLYEAVMKGFQDKGMPPWGAQLGPERTRDVVAFVLSVRNTNVANGKAPQGELTE